MATSSENRARPNGRVIAAAVALVVLAIIAASCTDDGAEDVPDPETVTETGPVITVPTVPLAVLDDLLARRVERAGLTGVALIVEQDGERLHSFAAGAVDASTPLRLAESGMWITAATIMSIVDDGLVGLDQPAGDVVASMAGAPRSAVTVRQLLSQTSGLPASVGCATPQACDATIATTTLLGEPGTVFALSPVGYHVLARVAEAVTGQTWGDVVAERVLAPLGLDDTRFEDPPREPATTGPAADGGLLAADGVTTAEDLGRFLTMILARGDSPRGRVLEEASVEEMERDQTPSLDTSAEPWVGATGIPTYGLGVWRDRLRGDGTALASMVSAPNRFGVYPLVDRTRNAWAVLAIDDDPVAPLQAVRDSAEVAQLMAAAIDTDGRPIRRPGSTIAR